MARDPDEKDTLFRTRRTVVTPFAFDAAVASVFDDMIRRSVPGYGEVIRREAQLAAAYYIPGTRIYDLGCSNGNLEKVLAREPSLESAVVIAVDSAPAMLQAFARREGSGAGPRICPLCMDIGHTRVRKASVVVINYTLQFIAPAARQDLLEAVFDGLVAGGILLLAEKITHPHAGLSALQQRFHHRFKGENGYSQLEISQKRDALENVLIPDTLETHVARLHRVGFDGVDVWHKWFNFAAIIAVKSP